MRRVQKKRKVAVVSHDPPVDVGGAWYSLYLYIYLLSQGSTVHTRGHDCIKQDKHVQSVKQSIRAIHLPTIN